VGGSIPPASTTQDFHAHRPSAVPRTSGAFARRAQASFKVRPLSVEVRATARPILGQAATAGQTAQRSRVTFILVDHGRTKGPQPPSCQRRVAIWISEGSLESVEGKGISGARLPAASLAQ
jgi:hypothetical protein